MENPSKIQIGFVCPTTGRVAVTLAEFAVSDFNGDVNAYAYNPANEAFEPWTLIDSIDLPVEGDCFDVWFGNGTCKKDVPGSTVIFVRASVAQALAEVRV